MNTSESFNGLNQTKVIQGDILSTTSMHMKILKQWPKSEMLIRRAESSIFYPIICTLLT